MCKQKVKSLAVVGFGLRGVILASLLPKRLIRNADVEVFERRQRIGGGILFDYDLPTNSIEEKFFKDISAGGYPLTEEVKLELALLQTSKDQASSLKIACALERVAGAFRSHLDKFGCFVPKDVLNLKFCRDEKLWKVETSDSCSSVRSVILATGRKEKPTLCVEGGPRVISFRQALDAVRKGVFAKGLNLRVLGASHSAFSLALEFLQTSSEGNVELFCREKPKPYFESWEQVPSGAVWDSSSWTECSHTGAINRDTGIRPPTRHLLLKAGNASSRLKITSSDDPVGSFLQETDQTNTVWAQAIGFSPNTPKLIVGESEFTAEDLSVERHVVKKIGRIDVKGLFQCRVFPTPSQIKDHSTQKMRNYDEIVKSAVENASD